MFKNKLRRMQYARYTLGVLFLFLVAPVVQANSACEFSRTLSIGNTGQDVQCLQEFLNSNGFILAESGVGSPGNETDTYGALTEAAVLRWQQSQNVVGANGNFGPASRRAYKNASSLSVTEQAEADRLQSIVAGLEEQLAAGLAAVDGEANKSPVPQVAGASDRNTESLAVKAQESLAALVDVIEDTISQIEDAEREDRPDLRAELLDAQSGLFAAITSYVSRDYRNTVADADDAYDAVADVLDDAGGETERAEAKEKVADVIDLYEEIYDLSRDADEDTGEAEVFLDEAEAFLEAAEDALRDRVYRQAISDALDAEERLEDAKDELSIVTKRDANLTVERVRDQLNDVRDRIEDAEDDGDDVEESEDVFADAKQKLYRADDAIDEEEWDEADEYAREAEDLLDDAVDAIGGSDAKRDEAKDALDDAWDEYRDVKDEIEDAEDDGDDVEDAEEYLDEARDILNEAEDAYDDGDYEEVLDLVDDAEDELDDAEDEL